jgi:hypothetical protein
MRSGMALAWWLPTISAMPGSRFAAIFADIS